MKRISEEELQKYLVKCCGCDKKHIQIGMIYDGKNYCQKCKNKLEVDVSTGKFFKKNEMTSFKAQGIYVKNPSTDLVHKSMISGEKIFVGEIYNTLNKPDIEKAEQHVEGKWALKKEFEANGFVLMSTNKWCEPERVFRYGDVVLFRDNFISDLKRMNKMVLSYNTKPVPIFRKTTELTHNNVGVPFLGIELEVNTTRGESAEQVLSEEVLNLMVKTDMIELLYMKRDGSIGNGVELVSHPTTLSYIKKTKLEEFLSGIKEIGFQDDDACGLHVHVSRDSLSKKGWWSLMTFMNKLSNKFLKISRRDKTRLNYCQFNNMTGSITDALINGKTIFTKDVDKNKERYSAMNFLNDKTVEFRMFRSTTDYNELIGTLQFVEALVMFCREYSFIHIQDQRSSELWNEFTSFAKKNGYSRLIKMLKSMSLYYINEKTKQLCA